MHSVAERKNKSFINYEIKTAPTALPASEFFINFVVKFALQQQQQQQRHRNSKLITAAATTSNKLNALTALIGKII